MSTTAVVPPGLHARLLGRMHAGPVSLDIAPDRARFCLRVSATGLAAASQVFGLALPTVIGDRVQGDGREALCLGPDEWVLYAARATSESIVAGFADRYPTAPHSLVDVSDREVSLVLEGAEVITLLSVGCPADPSTVPVGAGRRTVFDGASVVLRRDAEHRFRMDVWRSFLPHVWDLLNTANRELATGH